MAQTGTENKKNKKMSHITSIWKGGSISFTDNVKTTSEQKWLVFLVNKSRL
jgi:hypothetical protein